MMNMAIVPSQEINHREREFNLLTSLNNIKHQINNHMHYWKKQGKSVAYSQEFTDACENLIESYKESINQIQTLINFYEDKIYGASIFD